MSVDYEEVMKIMRGLVPALKKVEDEVLKLWISFAEDFVCCDRFGDKLNRALALYTLHLMFMQGAFKQTDDLDDYGKKVSQYTLSGEFSISYATEKSTSDKAIRQTPWGGMYELLNRKCGGGFGLIGGTRRPRGGRFLNGL